MTVVDGVVFLNSAMIVVSLIVGAVFFFAYSRKAPSDDDKVSINFQKNEVKMSNASERKTDQP